MRMKILKVSGTLHSINSLRNKFNRTIDKVSNAYLSLLISFVRYLEESPESIVIEILSGLTI